MTTLTDNENITVADGKEIPFTLLPKDRADCCGVEAMYRVKISDDLPELLFCGHHFSKHKDNLPFSSAIVDESAKLLR